MKIEDFKSELKNNRARVAATVSWEDCDRATQEVYFETDPAFADSLSCNPHAFLVGCMIPAMHYGERRVFIDSEICPELRDGLRTAIGWLSHWFYSDCEPVQIEAKVRSTFPVPRTPERAAAFFSGGIDSFATLRANRLNFPLEHPWSIKDGLLAFGLEQDMPDAFERVKDSLLGVAQEVGITLIPVYTNVYLPYRQEDAAHADRFRFWKYEFQGAALAAIAHAFARRLTVVSIAATFDLPNLGLWGSHPLLDPNYSSSDLRIRHDGIALSRFAKTKLVADWGVPLQHLRVCNQYKRYRVGLLNCGECEKCIRTMLTLLALGVLDQTSCFPNQHVSEDLVLKKVNIHDDYVESCYQALVGPLAEKGHHDLVRAVEYRIAKYHEREAAWKAKIKQFDHKFIHGSLGKLKRLVCHEGS
jgi:hypothetical protein